MTSSLVGFIQTRNGLTVFLDTEQHDVASDSPFYSPLVTEVTQDEPDIPRILELIQSELARLKIALNGAQQLRATSDGIYYGDRKLNDRTAALIKRIFDEGQPIKYLENFFERLLRNPSYRAIEDLYTFLEYGKMPITPDGYFLAYKAVRANFRDIHSGKFDNSIGKTVEMPRNGVDEDPTSTCSAGLHVCSYSYLPHFSHANGHIVIVKIDPADVVAIPTDYNNTKMRVSKYEVVGEATDWYKNNQNLLATTPVNYDYYNDDDDNEEDTCPQCGEPMYYDACELCDNCDSY